MCVCTHQAVSRRKTRQDHEQDAKLVTPRRKSSRISAMYKPGSLNEVYLSHSVCAVLHGVLDVYRRNFLQIQMQTVLKMLM